jgi:CBS domain-containing protein
MCSTHRIDTHIKTHSVSVGQVCAHQVITICASAALTEAEQLLREGNVAAIVVVAAPVARPTALGIITQRDIARAERERDADVSRLRVSDVLSRDPLVFNQEETVESAIRHLRVRDVQHALVVGSGGAFCGLVSLSALI